MNKLLSLAVMVALLTVFGLSGAVMATDSPKGGFFPAASGFTHHFQISVKIGEEKKIAPFSFSFKPEMEVTQRMVLCVPDADGSGKLNPEPWVTGPRISLKDVRAVRSLWVFEGGVDGFECCDGPFRAAIRQSNGRSAFEDVLPTGRTPKIFIFK